MKIAKYRRVSIDVEALQWLPTKEGVENMEEFLGRYCEVKNYCLFIKNPKTIILARPKDWIVKSEDEIYSYTPPTFEKMYELMSE